MMGKEYNPSYKHVNNHSSLTLENHGYSFEAMKYGERLRAARKKAGFTQKDLADRIKNVCTQENISKLERGDATGSEFTAQFAEACGVRAIWLAEEKGEMTDGLYIQDDRIKHGVMILEQLQAEYRLDDAINLLTSIAEFTRKKTDEK